MDSGSLLSSWVKGSARPFPLWNPQNYFEHLILCYFFAFVLFCGNSEFVGNVGNVLPLPETLLLYVFLLHAILKTTYQEGLQY